MHIEDLISCRCDVGHNFYIYNNEGVDLDEVNCPLCQGYIESSAERTVVVAVNGKETIELLVKYGK